MQDGRISYEEFAAMMKAGTDWRKASRQYSRERFNSLSLKLMRDGSIQVGKEEGRWSMHKKKKCQKTEQEIFLFAVHFNFFWLPPLWAL